MSTISIFSESPALVLERPPVGPERRELSEPEMYAFLRRRDWGVLATAGEDGPYGVPITYGFNDGSLYIATGPGLKLKNLEEDSRVCLTVLEVNAHDRWMSVVLRGSAELLEGFRDRARAFDAIRRQRSFRPSISDLERLVTADVFRIRVREMSGRTSG
jgi:uncharacterized protein